MPKPYSKDLRKKVMDYVLSGNSSYKASKKFEISFNTVRNWYKRYHLEGNYESRPVGGSKGRLNSNIVSQYVKDNPNFRLIDMGSHFNITAVGALYWLKKLGYKYKKKAPVTWKHVKRKEYPTKID